MDTKEPEKNTRKQEPPRTGGRHDLIVSGMIVAGFIGLGLLFKDAFVPAMAFLSMQLSMILPDRLQATNKKLSIFANSAGLLLALAILGYIAVGVFSAHTITDREVPMALFLIVTIGFAVRNGMKLAFNKRGHDTEHEQSNQTGSSNQ